MDWSRYPNFSREEFECSATGYCDMNEDFMEQVQILREVYGKPMTVNLSLIHISEPTRPY